MASTPTPAKSEVRPPDQGGTLTAAVVEAAVSEVEVEAVRVAEKELLRRLLPLLPH